MKVGNVLTLVVGNVLTLVVGNVLTLVDTLRLSRLRLVKENGNDV